MTPEQYLMQVRDINLRIRSLNGELLDAENENDEEYAKLLKEQIQKDIDRFKELKLRIRSEIGKIKDHKLSALLTNYYVRDMSWELVAAELNMNEKYVRDKLRVKAIKAFAAEYPNYFMKIPKSPKKP